jgi:ribosomal protein L6P/L9E
LLQSKKGQNPTITLEGIDRQLLGQVAAKSADYVSLNLTKEKVFVIKVNTFARKLVKQQVK